MQATFTVTPAQLPELLLNVATVRPVFLWGAPGIGKSSLVRAFAGGLGLECVSLLGTQLAPEDLIGVPQIVEGRSRFCPPESIARDEPYCLFLDELNAASPDVQKAFYSLILDRRIGAYELPQGSVVIGAGNRATDNALARPMASALINRLIHVHLRASAADWFTWAAGAGIHPWVMDYLTERPDQLWTQPPKTEEPFSTPRSWHMLSDALHSWGGTPDEGVLSILAQGTLTPSHAAGFCGYIKIVRNSSFSIPGEPPPAAVDGSDADEQSLAERWRRDGVPPAMADAGTAGPDPDQVLVHWREWHGQTPDWTAEFGRTLSKAITAAVEVAAGARPSMNHGTRVRRPWDLALSWFVASYPLLGSIASGMKIVADLELTRAQEIQIAAVDASLGEIYINPLANHTGEEWRFILAHESCMPPCATASASAAATPTCGTSRPTSSSTPGSWRWTSGRCRTSGCTTPNSPACRSKRSTTASPQICAGCASS